MSRVRRLIGTPPTEPTFDAGVSTRYLPRVGHDSHHHLSILGMISRSFHAGLACLTALLATRANVASGQSAKSPMPDPRDALVGIYADPPSVEPLWFREGVKSAVEVHERPASWGTHDV